MGGHDHRDPAPRRRGERRRPPAPRAPRPDATSARPVRPARARRRAPGPRRPAAARRPRAPGPRGRRTAVSPSSAISSSTRSWSAGRCRASRTRSRFSATSIVSSSAVPWPATPMCRRRRAASSARSRPRRSVPPTRTEPASGRSSPHRTRSSVVLPDPDRPGPRSACRHIRSGRHRPGPADRRGPRRSRWQRRPRHRRAPRRRPDAPWGCQWVPAGAEPAPTSPAG